MSEDTLYPDPIIEIADDFMSVTLSLVPGGPPEKPGMEACVTALRTAGVDVTPAVGEAIGTLLARRAEAPDDAHTAGVAVGEPVKPGKNGWLELYKEFDPDGGSGEEPDDDDAEHAPAGGAAVAVDHYNKRAFCLVKPGDRIGELHQPVEGKPGRDVRGKPIAVKSVKAYPLKLDATIEKQPDGKLIVRSGGVLVRSGPSLRVNPDLEIPGNVDFTTGNVRFNGDVNINKGVRDCFIVEATGSVTVRGMVEASTIIAGANAFLMRGMAAREKGAVRVGGDLEARYLDNVEGTVGGALRVQKEIINSRLSVAGPVMSESASMCGGSLAIGSTLELAEIGTESGVTTEIALGLNPEVDRQQERADSLFARIDERGEPIEREHDGLARNLAKLTKDQSKRHRTLSKAIRELRELKDKVCDALHGLRDIASRAATVDLVAHKVIHAGTRLRIGGDVAVFHESVSGPVRVTRDKTGGLILADLRSGSTSPLNAYARIAPADEAKVAEDARAA